MFVFVVLGFVLTMCTEQFPNRRPARLPYSDNPPKYRETWRRQHLESCSQATDTVTGNPSLMTGGSTTTTLSRLDVRSLFTQLPRVHRNPRSVSICVIDENQDTVPGTSRTKRANTDPQGFDKFEEPPSYAEAVRKERTESQCSPD